MFGARHLAIMGEHTGWEYRSIILCEVNVLRVGCKAFYRYPPGPLNSYVRSERRVQRCLNQIQTEGLQLCGQGHALAPVWLLWQTVAALKPARLSERKRASPPRIHASGGRL